MTALFVVGAPRSGTTLTRSLLRGFAGVYLPPDEFQILPRFVAQAEEGAGGAALAGLIEGAAFGGHMQRRGLWPGGAQMAQAIADKPAAEAFQAVVETIYAQDSPQPNASPLRYWGDKTPETVFHLDLVMRLWPQARVLYVRRDPRSTVLSMSRAWGRSLLRGAVIWRDAERAAQALAARAPEQIFTLPFETLTAQPGPELDRLGQWLGLPFDHSTLTEVQSEERWGKASGHSGVQARQADWQTALQPAQIRQIEEICFVEMQAAGFVPVQAQSARTPSPVQLGYAKASDALRVLRAYAQERGWPAALAYKWRQWRHR